MAGYLGSFLAALATAGLIAGCAGSPSESVGCELAPDTVNGHAPVLSRDSPEGDGDARRPLSIYTYDTEAHSFTREIVNEVDGQQISLSEFVYDDAGRLTEKVNYRDGEISSTTLYEYEGRLLIRETETSQDRARERLLNYDDEGRLLSTSVRSPVSTFHTRYTYGPNGFLTAAHNGFGPAIETISSSREYITNERGRITRTGFDGLAAIDHERDVHGNIVLESRYGSDSILSARTRHVYERVDGCVPNLLLHSMRFHP